jgi:acetylornithine deacetylase/succinyl-diaminopimelate desuccinylase-like protein
VRSMTVLGAALALALVPAPAFAAAPAPAAPPSAGQQTFRDLYRELVETDTSVATGSCTLLAQKIAERFRGAGFAPDQLTLFREEALLRDGGLVVTVPGTSRSAKPMLLLGHLDTVNANLQHWKTDPFKLVEKDGYFYGRGAADSKSLDAVWIDTLLRLRAEGFKPKRTIKLALTCGAETGGRLNGVQWLALNRPELLAAEFALNESGGGETDGHGTVISQTIAVGEMLMANFDIEAFSAGGPGSIPIDDNAIYKIADTLQKVRALKFPLRFNATTRSYFAQVGAARGDALGEAMVRLAADPTDSAAEAVVSADRDYNTMLHTTCVATLVQGGYILTALPQTAKTSINCYVLPGEDAETTRDALVKAIGNPELVISRLGGSRPAPIVPPLDPRILRPAEKLVARYFPGLRLVPGLSLITTDAAYLGPLGIPTYGVPGFYTDPDGNNVHGHDERQSVAGLYLARDFLHDLVKVYAAQE